MALGNFTVATVPAHENSVLGLSLLHWLLTGRPSVWPVMPNTAILNIIPCISGWVLCQPWARCPCAVSLLSGRQSASLGRPCASPPRLRGHTAGAAHPALPSCSFKAAGQCKLCFLGPARLPLHSGMVAAPQSLLCCWLRQPLSPRGCNHGPGPTGWKDPPQKSGPGVCA